MGKALARVWEPSSAPQQHTKVDLQPMSVISEHQYVMKIEDGRIPRNSRVPGQA